MKRSAVALLGFVAALAAPVLVSAGSQTYTAPGTFTAPVGGIVSIQVIGGGGGGGGGTWEDGYAGGDGGRGAATSITGSFGTLTAAGGNGGAGQPTGAVFGGPGGNSWNAISALPGEGGHTVFQTVTLTEGEAISISIGGGGGGGGGGGATGYGAAGGNGSVGSPAVGGLGGIGGGTCAWTRTRGHSGASISGGTGGVSSGGGGGGGAAGDNGSYGCASGLSGEAGTLLKGGDSGVAPQYTRYPARMPGGVAPGAGGSHGSYGGHGGAGGGAGQVVISWNVPAPACSITFDEDPLASESTVMHWSSSNAVLFYINNVGYVGASGSATVFSAGDYSGTVSGAGGTATCGGVLHGNSCEATSRTCGADGNLYDSCGRSIACQYGCSSATNQCNASCETYHVCDVSGTRVMNSCNGAVVEDCSLRGAGWACQSGACVLPSVTFIPFDATAGAQSFTATGHLEARPALVGPGQTARLYWNVSNATNCTVTGTNGDGVADAPTGVWNTRFSGASGKTTSPIVSMTTFTLYCTSLSGALPPFIEESVKVNVVPIFQEL